MGRNFYRRSSDSCDAFYLIEKVESGSYVLIPDMTVLTQQQELATRLYPSATLRAGPRRIGGLLVLEP